MAYIDKQNARSQPVSEWKLKDQMCDIGRRIWLKGFCAGNEGNHSYRLSENRILCTPSLISKGSLKPDDLCVVDLEGKQISGWRKRTSEILLHLAVYKTRPDVKAVIHSHPPHATAFAVAGVDLPTCIHPEAEVFLGPVKTAQYVTPGDKRLGESIAPYIKDSNTILLSNHGVICYGPDLDDAYYKLEIVDAYARILILAKQVGNINPLKSDEMRELLDLKSRFGMSDPRTGPNAKPDAMNCNIDFLSRVGNEGIATKGRVALPTGGTAPVPVVGAASPLDKAIANIPAGNYSDDEVEQMVQAITDQIMAAV